MTRRLEELASPYLFGLTPYVPGKPIEEVDRVDAGTGRRAPGGGWRG